MNQSQRVSDDPIGVLLAEDAAVVRHAVSAILRTESAIKVLGEATNFAETLKMTADLKPRVVLLDLHMPDEREFSPDFVKAQLLISARHILAISIWNDEQAETLAESYGASRLLDKAHLGSELIPTILNLA